MSMIFSKKVLMAAAAIATTLSFAGFAMAQSEARSTSTIEARRIEVKQKIQDMRQSASTSPSCASLVMRIDSRISDFNSKYEKHHEVYAMHRDKLLVIAGKVDAESGSSTAGLRANIAILEQKIGAFAAAKAEVEADLAGLKALSCGSSPSEFQEARKDVIAKQKKVGDIAKDIREFIRITLRKDVTNLHI